MIIQEQIDFLGPLCQQLIEAKTPQEKKEIVEAAPLTKQFLATNPLVAELLARCTAEEALLFKTVLAIGQGPFLFFRLECLDEPLCVLKKLAKQLSAVEQFYAPIGGVAGYHLRLLKLVQAKEGGCSSETVTFSRPLGLDLQDQDQRQVLACQRWGIDSLPKMAEIYPIGGAGDRLNLQDPVSGKPLPAAMLNFCGRSLLDGLIRDLQGREYLYYKLYSQQLTLPIALMTSYEKNNDAQVRALFQQHGWFGRPKEKCLFFTQPLVPVMTTEGNWAMQGPLTPYFKPGGHGVIWRAAKEQGVFDQLEKWGVQKALVRQINNPVAGSDNALLVLSGMGYQHNKLFGFASCPRRVHAAEGMNVLVERATAQGCTQGYETGISNVEYTDFKQHHIEDVPHTPGSPYSRFPANTNILFIDLAAVQEAAERNPFPGEMVNLKTMLLCDGLAGKQEKPCGRLESMMQNLADSLTDHSAHPLSDEQKKDLRTFLIYNERRKTISTTKKAYQAGKPLLETPEGCFFELMQNYRELLTQHCHMQLPPQETEEEYLSQGPAFVALFHPALGGIFQIIGQKIAGGRLGQGAEWIMEIAEADVRELDLEGSLIVTAEAVMGKKDVAGLLSYSHESCGKCTLHNVKVKNKGVGNRIPFQQAWSQNYPRREALEILLHGNAEFVAKGVQFEGSLRIEVPDGHRMTAYQDGAKVRFQTEKIDCASWYWHYSFDESNQIVLHRKGQ